MANYSRWEDVKNRRPGPSADKRAAIEQDLAMGQLIYDLRTEAGLSHAEVARLIGRGTATVITLTRDVAEDVRGGTRSVIERARAILRDGRVTAKVQTRPVSPRSLGGYLVGLAAAREAAGLNKKELAQRAGLSRETVSRIERLKRPAEPATVRALASALKVQPIVLVTPCEGRH